MARQILVIDDSSTMRQCIEWTFAFEDFVVASATSFQEAISDIDVVQPDVILLDPSSVKPHWMKQLTVLQQSSDDSLPSS